MFVDVYSGIKEPQNTVLITHMQHISTS